MHTLHTYIHTYIYTYTCTYIKYLHKSTSFKVLISTTVAVSSITDLSACYC